jgi:hypothetical protein
MFCFSELVYLRFLFAFWPQTPPDTHPLIITTTTLLIGAYHQVVQRPAWFTEVMHSQTRSLLDYLKIMSQLLKLANLSRGCVTISWPSQRLRGPTERNMTSEEPVPWPVFPTDIPAYNQTQYCNAIVFYLRWVRYEYRQFALHVY